MDENKLRFGVGVLILSAIGIGVILVFLFGAFPAVLNRQYTLQVKFDSAEGIGLNTPVVRDGVKVGKVKDIELVPEGGVLVSLAMDSDKPITRRYVPKIGAGSLVTGEADLKFVLADAETLRGKFEGDETLIATEYAEGDFLDNGEKTKSVFDMQDDLRDTFKAIELAGNRIAEAGQSVDGLVTEVRQAIGGADGQIGDVADQAVETLEEFQATLRDIRSIVGNPQLQEDLQATIGELPNVLAEARNALSRTEKTFDAIEAAGRQFEKVGIEAETAVKNAGEAVGRTEQTLGRTIANAEATFGNLEKLTRPFAEQGEDFAKSLLVTLNNANRTLAQLESFGQTLNSSNGTVKRLLEDDELYFEIRRTVENVEAASARLRPILDDVRIFSDKIARDPRQLGVRGAITRRPNGAGLK